MLKEKIENVHYVLGELMNELSNEQAEVLRQCRDILLSIGTQVETMENNLILPFNTIDNLPDPSGEMRVA